MNGFSTDLCNAINVAAHAVTALNAHNYFWEKQTPQHVAADLTDYLVKATKSRTNQTVILVGYSFGADVLPFIFNRLSPAVRSRVTAVVLIAPSTSTDFEIHITDMLGQDKKRSMDVIAEINRMTAAKTVIIKDSEDKIFPVSNVKLRNLFVESLPGSHHFDSSTKLLGQTILKYCK